MGATVTSFYFLLFLLCVLALYYLMPLKIRWIVFPLSGVAYYLLTGSGLLIIYPVATSVIAFFGARFIEKNDRNKKAILIVTVLMILSPLILLKYVNFLINTANIFVHDPSGNALIPNLSWAVPLGVSFYTFSALSSVIDVYNGSAKAPGNFLTFFSYPAFFPAILSGPILRYRFDHDQFKTGYRLNYHDLTFGAQRMLWGFFKTFVISERAKKVADCVYEIQGAVGGIYAVAGIICYAIELYTNFSGCMDIVIGMSQMFGIKLPENFNTPFFAKNIQEFWRRWHITLGIWMKEYVFYPVLRTRIFTGLNDRCKKRFGSKKGKQYATIPALFILWLTVGIWHGGDWKYVIGSGLLHWFYIVSGQLLTPFTDRVLNAAKIKKDAGWLEGLRIVRTFILVNIGFVFFRADSVSSAIDVFRGIFIIHTGSGEFMSSLAVLGMDRIEIIILLMSLVILTTVSILQQKGSVREMIDQKKLPVRWAIWMALLFFTILAGFYGPGYSAAEFIYQGF